MRIPIYQVDAFTSSVFSGNPAAVCPLESWLSDEQMQAIAAENNLSETAFFVPEGDDYRLRWFTTKVEVDLCGHATLASGYVLFNYLGYPGNTVNFSTRSGTLPVKKVDDKLAMDLPIRPPESITPHASLIKALGSKPIHVLAAERDYLVVYETEAEVRSLNPDIDLLSEIDRFGCIVTAPGENYDCVSRVFFPHGRGIPNFEDPVTGSAHCTIIPYWAERLNKTRLHVFQASARGGEIDCELFDDYVTLTADCAPYLVGAIEV